MHTRTFRYKDELAGMPFDEEVRLADAAAQTKKERHAAAIQWAVLPTGARAVLIAATACMVLGCYMVQLLACFQPYELTSKISDLPDGQWWGRARALHRRPPLGPARKLLLYVLCFRNSI